MRHRPSVGGEGLGTTGAGALTGCIRGEEGGGGGSGTDMGLVCVPRTRDAQNMLLGCAGDTHC